MQNLLHAPGAQGLGTYVFETGRNSRAMPEVGGAIQRGRFVAFFSSSFSFKFAFGIIEIIFF